MTISGLWAQGIGVDVGGATVLDGIDLRARPGVILGLAGPSGSGKTTLLHVLAGLILPDRGRVGLDGDVPGAPDVAVVLQSFGLAPTLTGMENVALPLLAAGRSAAGVARKCEAAMAMLGLDDAWRAIVLQILRDEAGRGAVVVIASHDPAVVMACADVVRLVGGRRAD